MNLIQNKEEKISILILILFCSIMFFAFLNVYPLIDVDETRYVRIAQEMFNSHNFLTPVINGEIFLEKPPLFFWIEDLSFLLFGVNEWSARLPLALTASVGVLMTYYFGRKLVSSRFGLISALTLGSSVIYIILSHIAILDLILSVTMMISVYFGILTLYSQNEKQNWLYWIGFYLFSSLSVLSKGLPGVVIPFLVVILAYFLSKRSQELLNFKKIGMGLFLMAIIVLPWHIMMYKTHGQNFIYEYILKHHIARFINSDGVNRKEPFWFYIPVILVGYSPFIYIHLTVLINEIRKIYVNFKNGFNFNIFKYFLPDILITKRFLSLNIMIFLVIFFFFSVASTKLPTYVLPAVFPLAYIIGYIFDEYIESNKFAFQIKISNIIISTMALIASIFGIVIYNISFLDINLNFEITNDVRIAAFYAAILFGIYSCFNFICIIKGKSQKYFFTSTIVFIVFVTLVSNLFVYNAIVNYGQNELINFAKYAKNNGLKLATFDFGHKYSVVFYYGNHVDMQRHPDYKWLNERLEKDYVVIFKNSNIVSMPSDVNFEVIETGKKYTLVKKIEVEEEEETE